ncbi:hypothetical protein GGX14DRAFT_410201 [Mycena pura]|uniref:BTB domain-containing protein n=1 Tax=Mycena pura TaxID=153505 RepID=A0AAD7E5L4_9AGAR|nr:hypothetical protein GGX14DRAFT_410201 [Mycena pura]
MALRKTADDQWTSTGVKSTFIVDMPSDLLSESSSPTGSTVCGWGWYFSCSLGPQSTTESPILLGTNSTPIPWRRMTVTFYPHLIANAPYGRITFDVAVRHLRLENEIFETEMDLPASHHPTLGAYMLRSDESAPVTIEITVQFPKSIGLVLPSPRDARVDRALAGTIRGQEITDVKFYAYTRVGDGYVASPRPLFAKLSLLAGRSDALDTYLTAISESELVDLDCDNAPEEQFAGYDYMSDSDLDDEEDERSALVFDLNDVAPSPLETEMSIPEPEPKMVSSASKSAEIQGTVMDPILPETPTLPDPAPPAFPAPPMTRRMGRVIIVKGFAFQTWNAFLYYLYTHQVAFRTLGSKPASQSTEIPKCSAKSMYKLAEYFDLDDLKNLALNSLRTQLSAGNIVRETFSTFSSMFAEIQDIEVAFLLQRIPEVAIALGTMLRSVCDGEKPKAHDVLCKIIRHGTPAPLGRLSPGPAPGGQRKSKGRSISGW